jgi:hypothetical protein
MNEISALDREFVCTFRPESSMYDAKRKEFERFPAPKSACRVLQMNQQHKVSSTTKKTDFFRSAHSDDCLC